LAILRDQGRKLLRSIDRRGGLGQKLDAAHVRDAVFGLHAAPKVEPMFVELSRWLRAG
jgi:hypothetical protein